MVIAHWSPGPRRQEVRHVDFHAEAGGHGRWREAKAQLSCRHAVIPVAARARPWFSLRPGLSRQSCQQFVKRLVEFFDSFILKLLRYTIEIETQLR